MAEAVVTARGPGTPPARGRARAVLVWALTLLVVGTAHVRVALDAVAPVQTKDEIGYLAAARLLGTGLGSGLLTPDYAGGYALGWGLLTAPLWWFTSDPPTVYALSVAVDVVLGVLVVLPSAALARRLGLGAPWSVVLAGVVALGAGRLGYSGYALPESLLALQLTTVAWLLLRLAPPSTDGSDAPAGPRLGGPRGGAGTAVALALLLAWLPTTHARFTPLALLGLALLAAWAWRARSLPGAGAVLVGLGAAAAGWWANGHVEQVLYGDVSRVAVAGGQTTGLQPLDVAALAVGHAWYAAAAWLGLALLGWGAAVVRAVQEGRRRRPGVWTWLAVGTPAQLGVGAAYLSTRLDVGARVDMLVYGRYGDPLWSVLAVVGGAVLLTTARPVRALLGTAGGVAVLTAATVVSLQVNADRVAGFVQLNVPGVEAWAWRGPDGFAVPWLPATALTLATLAGLALLLPRARAGTGAGPEPRRRPVAARRAAVLGLLAVVLLGQALVAEQRNIQPRDAYIRQLFQVRALVEDVPGVPVLLVVDRPLLLSGNALQWWLADRDPAVVPPGALPAGTVAGTLVVGPVADPPRTTPGGPAPVLLGTDPSGTYGVWQVAGTG